MKSSSIGFMVLKYWPIFLFVFFLSLQTVAAATNAPFISINPGSVIQGEPILVTVEGVVGTSSIKSISFDNQPLGFFLFQNKVSAFIGIDLHKKSGIYNIVTVLSDGTILQKKVTVGERPLAEAPLGIPQKLGGNTAQSQATLVSTLASENA